MDLFQRSESFGFPVLVDEGGKLFRAMGVFRKDSWKGALPFPAVLAFDAAGVLRYRNVTPNLIKRTRPSEVLEALAGLPA